VFPETIFAKRLKEAVPMRSKHQDIFAKFSATFKSTTVSQWEEMVKAWERDPTQPNPYEEPVNGEFPCAILYSCLLTIQ
jgi:hypothetical protein